MSDADERILRLLKDARRELEASRQRRAEPIAIVGIGCRFPGASTPSEFWRLLSTGVDATSEVPADRWDTNSVYDADPEAPGKLYVKRGGFLDRIDGFDPEFFGISPREAVGMDPQHRLLLEVAWEAIEDAGIPAGDLKGSATGVWVGLCLDDYERRSITSGFLDRIDPYSVLGNARSIAAGRIAYALDLKGPVLQLDTACSSSLVAVHQACQSLRSSESDVALVGGINLMSSPEATIALCKLRALSQDGRCKTFDASGDGYGRGEGCGMVVLKRLSDALAKGDRIYAAIRGTATNHDGRSNGLTAPNGLAQEAVIRAALANAGLEPSAVDYVETHGTGTLLGDPIEVLALSRVYGEGRSKSAPLNLGAVKTNIGHLEGAAGVASLIKLALCLDRKRLAAHLHFHQPNASIPWERLPVRVVTASAEWPRADKPRVGAVSSFGLSGTNAHALLEEVAPSEPVPSAPTRCAELIVLSARTPKALDEAAARLREHLESHTSESLADVAYSLATTRSLMESRLAFAVPTREALIEALRQAERGQSPAGAARGHLTEPARKVAWLFTGQGAQQLGMGRSLYQEWPVFREALDQVLAAIDPLLDRPLLDVMWAAPQSTDAALLDQTAFTQPALFALEWALAQLWRSQVGEPDFLSGHSIGEVTAAAVAGVFSAEDAARLVCARGRLMQALPSGGAMVSIEAPEREVALAVAPYARTVAVAAVNGLTSTVIAGVESDVVELAGDFTARGVRTQRLRVSHAFHSPLMDPMLEDFQRIAQAIAFQAPRIPIISNLSGAVAGEEISTARYWVDHVRRPVRFSAAVQTLYAASARLYVELGPKPTLLGLVPLTLPETEPLLLVPTLRPGRTESAAILEAVGRSLVGGGSVDWRGVFPRAGRRVRLPTYGWQRKRYWLESEPTREAREPVSQLESALRELAQSGLLSAAARAELPGILSALGQHQRAREHPVADAFHALRWRRLAPPVNAPIADGAWVIVSRTPDASILRDAFVRVGRECQVVGDVDSLRSLLGRGGTLRGVVHLMGAVDSDRDELRVLGVERALAESGTGVQAWWVTRGAVCTGPDDPPRRPAQAVIWGLARTFALEHPRNWGGIIDVPAGLSSEAANQLVALVAGDHGEDQLGLRASGLFAARLVRQAPVQQRRQTFATLGTCLVTGGLGGLGLHVARWLARLGMRHLLLVGRQGILTPGAEAAVAELEGLGASVRVVAADVTDRVQMTDALRQLPSDAPLTAVFHTAGIADTTRLEELTPARLEAVLLAKRDGTLLLDELTRGRGLEAFVCFSSIAGVWGSGSQAAYAAANAFLDAWAYAARDAGCPALSIAWGPWKSDGMASEVALEHLARRGLRALSPEAALSALEQALRADLTQAIVADVDWAKFRVGFEAWGPRALLQEIESPASGENSPAVREQPVFAELARLPAGDRAGFIRGWLMEQCAAVLGHERTTPLDMRRGFFDIGMDSLMLVELRRRLESGLGLRIPPGVIFSHPNIAALAGHLVSEMEPSMSAPREENPAGVASGEQVLLDSDEDVLRFINAKFEVEDDGSGR